MDPDPAGPTAGRYSRQGWADVATEVRERWQAGERDGAADLVTDDMVLGTTLIGTEPMVRERLRVWRYAGVNTVRLYPLPASECVVLRHSHARSGVPPATMSLAAQVEGHRWRSPTAL